MLEQRAFMLAGLGSAGDLDDLNVAVRLALRGRPVRAAGGEAGLYGGGWPRLWWRLWGSLRRSQPRVACMASRPR